MKRLIAIGRLGRDHEWVCGYLSALNDENIISDFHCYTHPLNEAQKKELKEKANHDGIVAMFLAKNYSFKRGEKVETLFPSDETILYSIDLQPSNQIETKESLEKFMGWPEKGCVTRDWYLDHRWIE